MALDKVFLDKDSGKDIQRPELAALLDYVRDGDTEKQARGRVWFAVLLGRRYKRSCGLSGRHRPGHCVAELALHR